MSILPRLLTLRPFAYHACGAVNFESIRRSRELRSAAMLLDGTAYAHLVTQRRKASFVVQLSDGPIEVRDNLTLRVGSLNLEPGLTLEQFLELLNGRVFLWPGNLQGPSRTGLAHFAHYAQIGDAFLIRVPLQALLAFNAERQLEATYCNSGSARHQQGKPVMRGPSTFQPIAKARAPASGIKELTFPGLARLPPEAMWSSSASGPWSVL